MKIKYANDKSIWNLTESAGVPLLVSPLLEETGIVKQGFSTKLGGVSKAIAAGIDAAAGLVRKISGQQRAVSAREIVLR